MVSAVSACQLLLKTMCRQQLTSKRQFALILPSLPRRLNRPNPARPFDDVFSFHFGFSGSLAALENLRWHHAVRELKLTTRSGRTMLRPNTEARWKRRPFIGNTIFRRQV